MSYRVFARKYRPQRFQDVVGQGPIIQTLQNAITTGKLAQAYLFVGPRGVGKTSTARIFAKALNCEQGPTIDPCGVCVSCIEIAEGRSLDVLEIDGASNNSVESIRTLRENAAFAPVRGPYKIYLIDEVHMLTTAAFNALLKTLEEPPDHVKFIFATTEAQKLPATITSRCQRFDLRRLSEQSIATHLLFIAEQEKILLESKAARALAHGADGALRDAESMLDQIIAFCGTKITEEDVQHVFGFTPSDLIYKLAESILTHNIYSALTLVSEQYQAGKDLSRLLGELITFFRDLLIEVVHPSEEDPCFKKLRKEVSAEKLLILLEELGKAEERFRWATNKKLQLDVLIIKIVHLLQEVSLTDVLNALTTIRGVESSSVTPHETVKPLIHKKVEKEPSVPALNAESNAKEEKIISSQTVSEHKPLSNAIETKDTFIVADSNSLTINQTAPEKAVEKVDNILDPWTPIAAELAAESPLKFGWVSAGKFLERSGNKLIIMFPPSCEAQTETLFWPQARKKIQECLSKNLGEKMELVCDFTGEEMPEDSSLEIQEEALLQVEVSKKTTPLPKQQEPSTMEKSVVGAVLTPEELEKFKNDPLIQKALEIFQAEIISG